MGQDIAGMVCLHSKMSGSSAQKTQMPEGGVQGSLKSWRNHPEASSLMCQGPEHR